MRPHLNSVRDYLTASAARTPSRSTEVWVTTPFEPTQANHIVWAKYAEVGGEQKVGVAFKLANSFSVDDVLGILKTAEKNAVKLGAGEPCTLKERNPPPRFQEEEARRRRSRL